jgi:hypothetical protein
MEKEYEDSPGAQVPRMCLHNRLVDVDVLACVTISKFFWYLIALHSSVPRMHRQHHTDTLTIILHNDLMMIAN